VRRLSLVSVAEDIEAEWLTVELPKKIRQGIHKSLNASSAGASLKPEMHQ